MTIIRLTENTSCLRLYETWVMSLRLAGKIWGQSYLPFQSTKNDKTTDALGDHDNLYHPMVMLTFQQENWWKIALVFLSLKSKSMAIGWQRGRKWGRPAAEEKDIGQLYFWSLNIFLPFLLIMTMA